LPSSAGAIDAVTEVARMAHAISAHQLAKRVLRTGGSEHDSSSLGLTVGYSWYVGTPRETNPTTAAAWDEAEIHRLQVGVKKAS